MSISDLVEFAQQGLEGTIEFSGKIVAARPRDCYVDVLSTSGFFELKKIESSSDYLADIIVDLSAKAYQTTAAVGLANAIISAHFDKRNQTRVPVPIGYDHFGQLDLFNPNSLLTRYDLIGLLYEQTNVSMSFENGLYSTTLSASPFIKNGFPPRVYTYKSTNPDIKPFLREKLLALRS